MPKVRASSATMGTMRGPSRVSLSRLPSMRTKAMVVLISLSADSSANWRSWAAAAPARGRRSIRAAASHHPARRGARAGSASRAVGRWLVEGQMDGLLVGQRQLEAVSELQQLVVFELLLAVRGHPALAGAAHAVTLLGVRQDHGGLAAVRRSGGIGGVDLHQVVPAALEAVDLLVGQALGQARQFGVLAEEVLAVVAPVLGGKGLHLAVHRLRKDARQRAAVVARKQAVPVAAPDQLDDVPARPGEQPFQLVDDAAVATHRAVQALQVAVDDPDQVVQPFACGQRQRALMLSGSSISPSPNTPQTLRALQSSRRRWLR
jgi:hypothetical protein